MTQQEERKGGLKKRTAAVTSYREPKHTDTSNQGDVVEDNAQQKTRKHKPLFKCVPQWVHISTPLQKGCVA